MGALKAAFRKMIQGIGYDFHKLPGDATFSAIMGVGAGVLQIGNDLVLLRAYLLDSRGGHVITATASDNATHALQFVLPNTGAGTVNVDGTDTTGTTDTLSTGAAGVVNVGFGPAGTHSYLGKIIEAGFWPVGFSSGNRTSMCHNQFARWGTATSC